MSLTATTKNHKIYGRFIPVTIWYGHIVTVSTGVCKSKPFRNTAWKNSVFELLWEIIN